MMYESMISTLVKQHYQNQIGCLNAIGNLVLPARQKAHNERIASLAHMVGAAPDDIIDVLASIGLMAAASKTFDDLTNYIQLGIEKGLNGRESSSEIQQITEFTFIAAKIYWDILEVRRAEREAQS